MILIERVTIMASQKVRGGEGMGIVINLELIEDLVVVIIFAFPQQWPRVIYRAASDLSDP